MSIKNLMLKYNHPIRKNIDNNVNNIEIKADNSEMSLQLVLNSMFAIKTTQCDDYIIEEHVSTVPATRLDAIGLKETLDNCLHAYQARQTGICDIRRQLYDQCFDEIIRQVTINCIELGLLLLRVRNEWRMTADAMQTVYDSGIAFAMRSALMTSRGDNDLELALSKLRDENEDLKRRLNDSQKTIANMISEKNEIIAKLSKHHSQQTDKYLTTISQQRMLIESLKRKAIKY